MILYRLCIEDYARSPIIPSICDDTGKTGLYFSNTFHLPLGMMYEYKDKPSIRYYLNIFSFNISIEEFNRDFVFHKYINVKDKHQCHIDFQICPIVEGYSQEHTEIFITQKYLDKLTFIESINMSSIDVNSIPHHLKKKHNEFMEDVLDAEPIGSEDPLTVCIEFIEINRHQRISKLTN